MLVSQRSFFSFKVEDLDVFKSKLAIWADQFDHFCFLDSNSYTDKYGKYDFIVGIDAINTFHSLDNIPKNQFLFGHIGYNDRNQNSNSFIEFRDYFLFIPRMIIYAQNGRIYIDRNILEAIQIKESIEQIEVLDYSIPKIEFKSKTPKDKYLNTINQIQNDIKQGRYYELNYCIEYYQDQAEIFPIQTFIQINREAKSPMSALLKIEHKYALSFSPERYIAKRDLKLIAQPIKGTARRDLLNSNHDNEIKSQLSSSTKELAENKMIVDLMRNDLSHFAKIGSIKVEELCHIYSFPFVHQMISTISCELLCHEHSISAFQKTLPAGSMTGAPKKEIIKAIKEYENFDRGLYAGSIGYIDDKGDFDWNVVIRTLFYDNEYKKISLNVGGAITLLSDPEHEYNECQLKSEGILKFFG